MSKIAVVTGGASGIGKAVAERLVKDNLIAVILDKDQSGGKQVVADIKRASRRAGFFCVEVNAGK